jgi:hypothetical protein
MEPKADEAASGNFPLIALIEHLAQQPANFSSLMIETFSGLLRPGRKE